MQLGLNRNGLRADSAAAAAPYSLLDLRQELSLEDAVGFEPLRQLPSEQQAPGSEVHQHVPHYLPQVHAADHLLIPASARTGK